MQNFLRQIIISSLIIICISRECEDGSECPGNKTCCSFEFGTGSCPYENGTCCSDLKHCCPNNMICSDKGSCIPSSFSYIEDNNKDKLFNGVDWENIKKCLININPHRKDIINIIEFINRKQFLQVLKHLNFEIDNGKVDLLKCFNI